MIAQQLSRRQKLDAILDATTVGLDDVVPHPRRRYRAACPQGRSRQVVDALTGRSISGEELDHLTADDILQEFGTA